MGRRLILHRRQQRFRFLESSSESIKPFHDHLKTNLSLSFMAGLYRNSGKATKSQDAGFVSEEIHTLCSCNKLRALSPINISILLITLTNCNALLEQIAFGLMVFQQFGGINGICFYTSSIFEQAGKIKHIERCFLS